MKKTSLFALMLIAFIALTGLAAPAPSAYQVQAAKNEANAAEIAARGGVPTLRISMDYENVKRRALYLNQANVLGYLYLLTENGQLVRESQVLGKVTSLNTYITPMEEIRKVQHKGDSSWGTETPVVVSAPDIDGTYGDNIQGIFWFTPDGVYQEWNGKYLFSSERLSFSSTPVLIKYDGAK